MAYCIFFNRNKILTFTVLTDIMNEQEITLEKNFSFPLKRIVINKEKKRIIQKHLQNETDPFLS